jgi:MFS family permease
MALDRRRSASMTKDRRYSSISRDEVPIFQDERSDLTPRKSITNDEEQPLLHNSSEPEAQTLTSSQIASIIAVILLGELLASMDGTFVTAAGPTISSHFSRLEDLNWLTTAYLLGVAVVQPTIGKMSDIFGRKAVLLVSYFLYTLGRTVCGLSNSMGGVIGGRAIGGMGGAGMMTVASIVVTEVVPQRDLAMWRSYVNLVMTLGRSLGGPFGGMWSPPITY